MNARFFLDTNVLVYSFDRASPEKAARATLLVQAAVTTRQGIISYQVAQEFLNVALRRFVQPMTAAEAEQYLSTVLRPLMAVPSSPALYSEALRLTERYRLAWYHSLILAGAILGQCGTLYSEDFQHGQRFGSVQVENPFL
jgi:predicted nucleic acid-binding protein